MYVVIGGFDVGCRNYVMICLVLKLCDSWFVVIGLLLVVLVIVYFVLLYWWFVVLLCVIDV